MHNIKSIIYIFNGRFPTEKAHGIQIAKMCEAFSVAGIPVTLMVPYRYGALPEDPFDYYGLKKDFKMTRVWGLDPLWLWNYSQRVAYYLQIFSSSLGILINLLINIGSSRKSILYTRDYPTLILLAMLGFSPVVEVHDYRLTRPSRFLAWSFSRARKIIVNSVGTKVALLKHYPIPTGKLLACPNGVDTDFFNIKIKQTEAREKLGLPLTAFIIGYTGRLETAGQSKGVDILIQAFELMHNNVPNAYLCIVGGSKSVPYWQIPLYLRSFDVAVLPLGSGSLARTTAPMKLFEYLASGCAIVAADASSIREYLDDSTAVFFDSTSPESLALTLQTLAQNDQKRASLREAAWGKAPSYTWNLRAINIINFIQ